MEIRTRLVGINGSGHAPFVPYLEHEPIESLRKRVLEPVFMILPPMVEPFVPREKFFVGAEWSSQWCSGVKIGHMDRNFIKWFLLDGKVEEEKERPTVYVSNLLLSSSDWEILAEIGGGDKAQMSLGEMCGTLEFHEREGDTLLTTGWANVFYVPDSRGILRSVGVYKHNGRWCFRAYPLTHSEGWSVGVRVCYNQDR